MKPFPVQILQTIRQHFWLPLLLAGLPVAGLHAAPVTLTATDAIDASSFNTATYWSNAAVPSSGNDYFVSGGFQLRTPIAAGDYTFGGNSLTLGTGSAGTSGTLTFKGLGVITVNNLKLDNSNLINGGVDLSSGNLAAVLAGTVQVLAGGGTIFTGASSPGNRTIEVRSTITGSGALTFSGGGNTDADGLIILGGAGTNTYSGGSTVGYAKVRVGKASAFGANTGNLTLSNANAIVDLNNFSITVGQLTGIAGAGIRSDVAGTMSLTVGNGVVSGTSTYAGVLENGHLSAAVSLIKTGSGTQILSGVNTYTGGTTLTAGTLQAGSDTAFGSGVLNLTSGKLSSDSTTARVIANAVTFGGDVTLGDTTNTGVLTFNGAGTLTGNRTITTESNVTYAGAIGGGANGLTKAGAGDLTFSAVNTYTGTTLVSGGTLILSGSGSIANSAVVDVQAGAILSTSGVTFGTGQTVKGNGTIIGDTILQGTLAAGNSPGILSFDDDLTLTSSANSIFEIENSGMVRGTDYDGVNVVSSLTYDGTLTLSLTTLISDGTYNLFDFGSIAGNFDTVAFSGGIYTGTFSHSGGFWTATDLGGSGQTFSFELASGNLTVIPEPSTTLLLTGALTALVIFRRRRA